MCIITAVIGILLAVYLLCVAAALLIIVVLAGKQECSCCEVAGECTQDLISHCTLCPPGMYQDHSAQNHCTPCLPGSYSRLLTLQDVIYFGNYKFL